MSINDVINYVEYAGDNSSSVFAFPYAFFEDTDLVLTLINTTTGTIAGISAGDELVLTLGVDYTLTLDGDAPNSGVVTIINSNYTNLPVGLSLYIERILPETQLTRLSDNEKTPAKVYENVFDRAVMLIQQLSRKVARTLQLPTSTTDPVTFPTPEAGKYLVGVSATEVAWQAISETILNYNGSFLKGLDAGKAASPSLGDGYVAYDTAKLYLCFSAGVWTEYTIYINNLAAKTTIAANDIFLLEDSAALYAKKKVTFTNLLASITDLTKVKASSGDATPGYLDAKVDGVTVEVNGSNQLAVKSPYIGQLKYRTAKSLPAPATSLAGSACIMQDGSVRVWGASANLGIGTSANDLHIPGNPALPATVTYPIQKVYVTYNNIFIIDANGWVFGAGTNAEGELGDGTTTASLIFKRIGTLSGVTKLVIPRCETATISIFALKANNELWAWGLNTSGQLGVGTIVNVLTPTQVTGSWLDVACAGPDPGFSIGIKTDNKAYSTGINGAGQLGHNDLVSRSSFTAISALSALNISKVYCMGAGTLTGTSFFITDGGAVYASGDNANGQLCDGSTTDSLIPVVISSVTGVSSLVVKGDYAGSVIAIKNDGTVRTWGYNGYGECGDGTTTARTSAYNPGLSGITKGVFGGGASYHTAYLLKSDGTIYSCGYGVNAQLGNGGIVSTTSFAAVLGVPAGIVSDISVSGYSNTCNLMVLTNTGQVFMCGYNTNGQLGIGTAATYQAALQPAIL